MSHTSRQSRRGYAAVIAMVMLVIGTALATSFAAMLRSAQSIAGNQQAMVEAKRAAESGLEFLRYKLIKVAPDAGMTTRTSSNWIPQLMSVLQAELDYSRNLGYYRVMMSLDRLRIYIPRITLADSTSFTASITPSDITTDDGLTLTVTGRSRSGTVTRKVAINLNCDPERMMSALRFAIAAKGGITLPGNTNAGVYGYDPATGLPDGRKGVDVKVGDDPNDPTEVVALLRQDPPESLPDFSDVVKLVYPQTDTSFLDASHTTSFATVPTPPNRGSVTGTLTNQYIPANSNFTFGDVTIRGILYVEWPNNLTFNGNVTLDGLIVYQPSTGSGSSLISLSKDINLNNRRAQAITQLNAITWLTDAQRKALASWAIIAPQTDFKLLNGNATTKYFENSIHVNGVTKEAGEGNADTALIMNQASLLAEGAVTLSGNRVFWMKPAEDGGSDGNSYTVRSLFVMQTTYREPL